MMSLGWPEVIILAGVLLALALPIWIAWRAKPIGELPYRWGCYVGITNAFSGLGLVADRFGSREPFEIATFGAMGVVAIISSVGILRRRQWGLIWGLFSIPSLLLLAMSFYYFKKRWKYMGAMELA